MMNHISNTLPHRLLEGLNKLRNNRMYCDVTIIAGSSELYAHRAVLVSVSNYFASMHAGNFAESQQNEVVIDGVGEKELKLIVDFIYTTKITIDENNVQSLLQSSIYLQVIEVKDVCCDFIKQRLHPSNCLAIKHLAQENGCVELSQAARSFVESNFEHVLQTEEFISLRVEQIIEMISSDNLVVKAEQSVYQAIMTWTSHGNERQKLLPSLLSHVRKYLIPQVYLDEVVKDNQQHMPKLITGTRRMSLLFAVGMFDTVSGGNLSLQRYCFMSQRWYDERPIRPHLKTKNAFGVAVFNKGIYVLGGFVQTRTGTEESFYSSSVERYDPLISEWCDVQPMNTARVCSTWWIPVCYRRG